MDIYLHFWSSKNDIDDKGGRGVNQMMTFDDKGDIFCNFGATVHNVIFGF